jgi:hypothetical protein
MESPQPSKFQQKMVCQTKVAMSNLEKPSSFFQFQIPTNFRVAFAAVTSQLSNFSSR